MSTLGSIITQINSLTGYMIPTASGIIISASSAPGSGSVNSIVDYINSITGFSIPYTSASIQSGAVVAGAPIVYSLPTPATGTIPTEGIFPGAVIKADHVLRIINALNGINPNLIILSGSLQVTGSANFSSSLILPFIPNEEFPQSISGSMTGTGIDGGFY
jgi:hypothetical protein